MEQDIHSFEQEAGVSFADKKLLKQAFTHRSYLNEHRGLSLGHNERLEFLGDAVLELAVTEYLFNRFQEKAEGELTAIRSALVNTSMLSSIASDLSMGKYLLLSKGEAKDTGRARQYILANTFEAFVGALYLDQGFPAARDFIERYLIPQTDSVLEKRLWLDAKSNFQERSQERFGITPRYEVLRATGPDHKREFTVAVYLEEKQIATGAGKSKQEAEQSAAHNALLAYEEK